jgi:hypothetical protein
MSKKMLRLRNKQRKKLKPKQNVRDYKRRKKIKLQLKKKPEKRLKRKQKKPE